MKLTLQQLPQHLINKLLPIYLINTDETLLAQEALDLLRSAAQRAGFSERIRVNTEDTQWGKNFFSNAQSFSLFSTKRLLELDLTNAKLTAPNTKLLQEYAQETFSDTVLIIRTNKLESKTEQTAWFKSLEKIGGIITLWPISIEQLPAWILQRAKKLNLNMTKSAAELLATLVEGNLLAASQELEKLCLLADTDVIDEHAIENKVIDHAHFDIFALVNSVLSGNSKRSLRILRHLSAEGTEPTLILWALTRELRTMAEMGKQIKQGVSLTTLFPKFRIFEKRQPGVRAFLQRYKEKDCWNLLTEAASIDRIIKGAEPGNVWDRIEQLVGNGVK